MALASSSLPSPPSPSSPLFPAPSVLVLGARGRFGLAATRAFAQAGWRVHAQLRPGATGPAIPGVHWLAAQPQDTAALAAAARGASVVVQALSPPYTHKAWREQVPGLTQAAIDVSRALRGDGGAGEGGSGCKPGAAATLMLPASVYNFGSRLPQRLHEDTAQLADTVKGRLRLASEQQILAATQDGGMKAVVIRGGDFFGSGTGAWLDLAMARDLRQGKLTYPGPLDQPHAWAYLPDMARSFVSVAQRRAALPAFETLHFAGHAVTGQDWVDALTGIAREQGWLAAGAPLKVAGLPWPLMRLVGLFVPTVAALCEMRYLWRMPHALVDVRMAALTGEVHHTPFREAVRAALGELGLLTPQATRSPAGQPSLSVN